MSDTARGRGGRGPQGSGGGRRDGARRDARRRDGRPGEPSGGRATGRVEEASVVVDRREGVRVFKVSRVEHASHRVVGVVYRVEFEGRTPIDFDRLGAARDRAKEPPPEPPAPAPETSGGESARAAGDPGPQGREAGEAGLATPGEPRPPRPGGQNPGLGTYSNVSIGRKADSVPSCRKG